MMAAVTIAAEAIGWNRIHIEGGIAIGMTAAADAEMIGIIQVTTSFLQ